MGGFVVLNSPSLKHAPARRRPAKALPPEHDVRRRGGATARRGWGLGDAARRRRAGVAGVGSLVVLAEGSLGAPRLLLRAPSSACGAIGIRVFFIIFKSFLSIVVAAVTVVAPTVRSATAPAAVRATRRAVAVVVAAASLVLFLRARRRRRPLHRRRGARVALR